MTLSVLPLVGTVLLLAAWTSAQIQPCDPLNSSGGAEFQTLFVSVEEASNLALTQAQQSGTMDKYRGRIEISGRLNDTIQLTLLEQQDGGTGCLQNFQIVAGSSSDVFYLQLVSGVDRDGATPSTLDDLNAYYCRIQCVTAGRNTTFLPVTITIQDVNDNPPAFVDAPYSRTVNELTPIGTTVFRRFSATDKDGEGNKEVDFSFTSSIGTPGADKFSIDLPRQGFVTVNDTLDFETLYYQFKTNTYNLTVMGKDTGTPSLSATTQLVITLEDGDDLGPMFVYSGCITYSGLYPICIEPELTANIISGEVAAGGNIQTYPLTGSATSQPVTIRARDQDTLNAAIAFSLETTGFSSYFSLSTPVKDTIGGVDFYEVNLVQQRAIDRATTKEFFLIIRAEEQTTNRRFATTRISVSVNPSNRFAPTLSANTIAFTGYVQENSAVGTMVTNQARDQALKLTIQDQDVSSGDPPGTYELSIVGSSPFTVSSDGFVSVASSVLDYESNIQYTPVVAVRETGTTQRLSSSVTLTINVLDVNDYAPVFPQGGYTSNVPARDYSTVGSSQVTSVLATDLDSGVNGQITYAITSAINGGAGKFTITDTPNNGAVVNVVGSVARGEQYALTIRATDKATVGKLSGETVLVVNVVADGNTPPQIGASQYDVRVSEGVLNNTLVFTVPGTDIDGNSLSYVISSGNLAGDFAISSSGDITNIDTLDRESIASYSLVVTVRDNGTPSGSASTTVSIFVTDINDNNPQFNPPTYTFSVQEGLPNVLVGTVTATDADEQNTARSAITYPPLSSTLFRIEAGTGNIYTLVGLDYETQQTHKLTVVASDLASDARSSTVSVTVNVVDVADYVPRFVPTVYQAVVPENQANFFVTTVSAVDQDTQKSVVYKFLSGDFGLFTLSPDGTIRTARALDYETVNVYLFQVTTADGENSNIAAATATVSVRVQDQNDFRPVIGAIPGAIIRLESVPVGNELLQVTATDGDPPNTDNSRIRYSIVSVNPTSGRDLFYIGPESGQLVIRSPLTSDANRPPQYQISIQAADLGTPPLTGNSVVTLVVQRNLYAPVFSPTSFAQTIPHTFPIGDEVLSVSAYDNDTVTPYGDFVFSVNRVGNGPEYFDVSQAGQITLKKNLVPDTALVYDMEVVVTDSGGLSDTAAVRITVDRNLNTPAFVVTSYNVTIVENYPLATSVVKVQATDQDLTAPHNTVVFSITSDARSQEYFTISDQGDIMLKKSPTLDRTISAFQMTIGLRDAGLPTPRVASSQATVLVNILRNSASPLFFNQTYEATINENVGTGYSVIKVSAMDTDQDPRFNQVSYEVIGDDNAGTFFAVDAIGQVTTKGDLRLDPTNEYFLRIRANDNGSPPRSAEAVVKINVRRNFQTPQLNQNSYSFRLLETFPVGNAFLTISATDTDSQPPNNVARFEIVNFVSPAEDYFTINSVTGELSLIRYLYDDSNDTSNYQFSVRAYDMGSPRLTSSESPVNIEALRNVFEPSFVRPYSQEIPYDEAAGTSLLTVSASDNDPVTQYGVVRYRILGDDTAPNFFSIDPATGEIRLVAPVQTDTLSNYKLRVEAFDNGQPAKKDVTVVNFLVNRNLNAPQFQQLFYSVNIFETQSLVDNIQTVIADDQDTQAPYNQVTYSIEGIGQAPTYFGIRNTLNGGEVFVRRPLTEDTQSTQQYTLTVRARDGGPASLQSAQLAQVLVNVTRNLYAPRFIPQTFSTEISLTHPPQSSVFTLSAVDDDTAPAYNTVSYEITGDDGAQNLFSINATGTIFLLQNIQFSGVSQYRVRVRAFDRGSPPKENFQVVRVLVNRNLFKPVFNLPSGPSYTASVSVRETIDFSYLVYVVNASDQDASSPYNSIRYSIVGDGDAVNVFGVNSATGAITLKKLLLQDRSVSTYAVRVSAEDGGSPPLVAEQQALITVNVIRNQFTPYFVQLPYDRSISQSLGKGAPVVQVSARDDDSSFNIVRYEIIGDGPATVYFGINEFTGQVSTKASLASDPTTRYTIRVRASDDGNPSLSNTTTFTVIVDRNLNKPVFVPLSQETVTIPETQQPADSFYTVTATDADTQKPFNQVNYEIVGDAIAQEYFTIDASTGAISVKKTLTEDAVRNSYSVTINAYDLGEPRKDSDLDKVVVVRVERNANGALFAGSPYTRELREDAPASGATPLISVTATDADQTTPFNKLSYSLVGDSPAEQFFSFNKTTGAVRLVNDLRAGTDLTYILRIEARDGGSPPRLSYGIVNIVVKRNLYAPAYNQTTFTGQVVETYDLITSPDILTVFGADRDFRAPYNTIRYYISSAPGSSLGRQYFSLDPVTGALRVRQPLTADTSTTYSFDVTINDLGDQGGETRLTGSNSRVTIQVIRNLFAPEFSGLPYETTMNYTANQGDLIFTPTASDQDTVAPFSEYTYRMEPDGVSSLFFNILNPATGAVRVRQSVIDDSALQYQVRIVVADGGTPPKTNTATATISVNRNLFAPVWQVAQSVVPVTIDETLKPGSGVYTLSARDVDLRAPANIVRYQLQGQSDQFSVDQYTGQVTVRRPLTDYPSSSYQLVVVARDEGLPNSLRSTSLQLNINVNKNNFPPVFYLEPYAKTIRMDLPQFSSVIDVYANDSDSSVAFNTVEYAIVGDSQAMSLFSVDSTSGQIRLQQPLVNPQETYSIVVAASDKGIPPKEDVTLVSVSISTNLNAPRFVTVSQSITILETQTLGDGIFTLQAEDGDSLSPSDLVSFFLTGNPEAQNYFTVNQLTGEISLTHSVLDDPNRLTTQSYTLTFRCEDRGFPVNQCTNQVTLTVNVDRNLNRPEFSGLPYQKTIPETSATGTSVTQVTLSDRDAVSPFNSVSLTFIGDGSATSFFDLDLSSANRIIRVSNQTQLLADTSEFYTLRLLAEDGGKPPLSATALVEITVERNLFAPAFLHGVLSTSIPINSVPSRPIVNVNATDRDLSAPNNEVTYSSVGEGLAPEYFFVRESDGQVLLTKTLPSTPLFYRLRVRATDGGARPRSSETTVEITITTRGQPLAFSLPSYTETITENEPVGNTVRPVTASPGPGITYSLNGYSSGPEFFQIEPSSGNIVVVKDLKEDAAKLTQYFLNVVATKTGSIFGTETATTQVNITVQRNVNGPQFTEQSYYRLVSETLQLGSSIVQISATDNDVNDKLTYSLVPSAGVTEYFYVNPNTGLVSLQRLLTGTTNSLLEFSVRVGDSGQPSREASSLVVVNVTRDRFPPVFQSQPYSTIISEKTSQDVSIYNVLAIDQDLQGQMTYATDGYLSAPWYFYVNSTTGAIRVRANLRDDRLQSYTLGLMAYDSSNPNEIARANVTISVRRNENAPQFNPLVKTKTIPETFGLGRVIETMTATDNDNDGVRYYLDETRSSVNASQFFLVMEATGEVIPFKSLTMAALDSYTVSISAQDTGFPMQTSVTNGQLAITITRNQYSPEFNPNGYTVTINDTQPVDSSILQVSATDNDPPGLFSDVRYDLLGDESTPVYFRVDPVTGTIFVKSALDTRATPVYRARIRARDLGSPARSATVMAIINVNHNLNSPAFVDNTYQQTIPEEQAVGVSILQLSARDIDAFPPYNSVTFALEDPLRAGSNPMSYFQLDPVTGILSLKQPVSLDTADTPVYQFQATVRDGGNLPGQPANIIIRVNRNGFSPEFINLPNTTAVNYNTNSGIQVFTVLARDSDSVNPYDQVFFSIIGDDQATQYFDIGRQTGVVVTKASLLTDNSQRYTVRVLAQDGGIPARSATATLAVTVTRNLFTPIFTQQNETITVLENENLGRPLVTLRTEDRDISAPYNTRIFTIVSDTTVQEYFQINSLGEFSLKKSLTLIPNINLLVAEVSLKDGGSPPRTSPLNGFITITILRNGHVPYFVNEPYVRDLGQSTTAGTPVLTVTAMDDDLSSTPYGTVVYDLIGDDGAQTLFQIGRTSGVITIGRDLGSSSTNKYTLRVRAQDLGVPSNFNTTLVTVTVATNFQSPRLVDLSTYTATVPETTSLGTVLMTIKAEDNDPFAPNNEIRYAITQGADSLACLDINEVTGDIYLKSSLLQDPCKQSTFSMRVRARDLGTPSLSSSEATATVVVQRNLNTPRFLNPANYVTLINETVPVDTTVLVVSAQDGDSVEPFNKFTFQMVGDDMALSYFLVNETTGAIVLTNSLLADTRVQYKVRVKVSDGGIPALSSYAVATINVQRNLYRPVISPIDSDVVILETQELDTEIERVKATDVDSRGDIMLKKSPTLDRTIAAFQMTIGLRDAGLPTPRVASSQATVLVNILHNSASPLFFNQTYEVTINENVGTGYSVIKVSAMDTDQDPRFNQVSYEVIGDDNAGTFFAVDAIGQVTTKGDLRLDPTNEYFLRIRANDNGSPPRSAEAVVKINVRRNFQTPQLNQNSYSFRLLETFPVGNAFLTISATDTDSQPPNNVARFEIVNFVSPAEDYFTINSVTGELSLIRYLYDDSNDTSNYQFSVRAYDMGIPRLTSTESPVKIEALRNVFEPSFATPYSQKIPYDETVGTSLLTVSASDNDPVATDVDVSSLNCVRSSGNLPGKTLPSVQGKI